MESPDPDRTRDLAPANPPDATPDAQPDAQPDATPNAQPDATPNAQPDATPNAQPDATPNAQPDATPEAPAAGPAAPQVTGQAGPPDAPPPGGPDSAQSEGAASTTPPGDPSFAAPPPGAGPYPPPGAGPYVPPGPWPTGGRRLVRTRSPKILAGVCGGLARATNTDPILFRVVLVVLVFFGGIGAVLYLLGWLLLPMEGESASPAEALLGKGSSSTSAAVTIVIGIAAVIALGATLNSGFNSTLLLAAIVLGIALLLRRNGAALPGSAGTAGPPGPVPSGPMPSGPMEFGAPGVPPVGVTPPSAPPSTPSALPSSPPSTPAAGDLPVGPDATAATAPLPSPAQGWAATSPLPGPASLPPGAAYSAPYAPYREPFAPHGPYAGPPAPPATAPPARPRKPRSVLGRITLSVVCLGLAILGLIDAAGASIPFVAYPALALTIIALGLLVGTWFGRSRLLIVLGVLAALTLGIGTVSSQVDGLEGGRPVTYAPLTLAQVRPAYDVSNGKVVLDLSRVDFTEVSRSINLDVGAGEVTVLVPPTVDVASTVHVGVGSARLFDVSRDGLGIDLSRTDLGPDGKGGGTLDLDIDLGAGELEVSR